MIEQQRQQQAKRYADDDSRQGKDDRIAKGSQEAPAHIVTLVENFAEILQPHKVRRFTSSV